MQGDSGGGGSHRQGIKTGQSAFRSRPAGQHASGRGPLQLCCKGPLPGFVLGRPSAAQKRGGCGGAKKQGSAKAGRRERQSAPPFAKEGGGYWGSSSKTAGVPFLPPSAQQHNLLFGEVDHGVLIDEPHGENAAQQVDCRDIAPALFGVDQGTLTRRGGEQRLIGLLLVFEAAHQAAAGAGNLGGVEREPLLLGHFNGDGAKLVHVGGAAKGPSADAKAAQHLGLVAHPDLTQLECGCERPRRGP